MSQYDFFLNPYKIVGWEYLNCHSQKTQPSTTLRKTLQKLLLEKGTEEDQNNFVLP